MVLVYISLINVTYFENVCNYIIYVYLKIIIIKEMEIVENILKLYSNSNIITRRVSVKLKYSVITMENKL